MFEVFSNYLAEKFTFTNEEILRIKSVSNEVALKKGGLLLQEGQLWKSRAFVCKGLLRMWREDEHGQEHIIRLAPENWWAGDAESYLKGKPSVYTIDALEPTDVLVWDRPVFDALIGQIPALQQMSELLMSRSLIATQNRVFTANSLTADEKYTDFLITYPELAKRIPLHMIASYLGVTRETLSRARRLR